MYFRLPDARFTRASRRSKAYSMLGVIPVVRRGFPYNRSLLYREEKDLYIYIISINTYYYSWSG
jgi:hypothetical protein